MKHHIQSEIISLSLKQKGIQIKILRKQVHYVPVIFHLIVKFLGVKTTGEGKHVSTELKVIR